MFVSHETPGEETPNLCQRLVAFYLGFFRTLVHSFGCTGSSQRRAGSSVVAHWLTCSSAFFVVAV